MKRRSFLETLRPLALFNRKEKLVLAAFALARIISVLLDLLGLVLLSMSVSQATGVVSTPQSLTGKAVIFITSFGASVSQAALVLALFSIMFFVFKSLVSIFIGELTTKYLAKLETEKAIRILKSVLRFPHIWGAGKSHQTIIRSLTHGIDMGVGRFMSMFLVVVGELALVGSVLIFLAIQSLTIFTFLAGFLLITGWIVHMSINRRNKNATSVLEGAHRGMVVSISDSLKNVKQAFPAGRVGYFLDSFSSSRVVLSNAQASLTSTSVLPRFIVEIAIIAAISLIFAIQTVLLPNGFQAGVSSIFIAGLYRLAASLLPLQGAISFMVQASYASRDAIDLFLVQNHEPLDGKVPQSKDGNIVINLKDISGGITQHFVPFGSLVKIGGDSGSGKSTLIDELAGFSYSPGFCEIKIDSMSPADFVVRFPGDLAYVPQDAHIFAGTLRQNLKFDDDPSDDLRLRKILGDLGLENLLGRLPDGLGTHLSPDSKMFSGGEIQRIAFARAILQNARIFLLDEVSSSLDKRNQDLLLNVISKLRGTATVFLVSHQESDSLAFDYTITLGA